MRLMLIDVDDEIDERFLHILQSYQPDNRLRIEARIFNSSMLSL